MMLEHTVVSKKDFPNDNQSITKKARKVRMSVASEDSPNQAVISSAFVLLSTCKFNIAR